MRCHLQIGRFPSAFLALLMLAGSLSGRVPQSSAADDVVQQIPHTALAYVVVKNLQQTSRDVDRTAERMQLAPPNLLGTLKQRLNVMKGIDDNGDLALAVIGKEGTDGQIDEQSMPMVALFVPTTNYDELIGQLNPQGDGPVRQVTIEDQVVLVAKRGDYAVITAPIWMPEFETLVDAARRTNVEAAAQSLAQQADIYAVATPHGVALGMKRGIATMQMARQQFGQQDEHAQPVLMALGIYENMFQWIADEVSDAALSLEIADAGAIYVRERVSLKNPGQNQAAESAGPAAKQLAPLPNWPYIAAFSIAMGDSDAASGWMKFSVDMMTMMSRAQQMSKEQTEQLIAATRKSLEGLRGMSFTFGVPQAGRSIYSRMGMIMDVDDSKAYLENYQQTIEKMKEIFADLPNSPYRLMSVEKTTVAGVEGLKMVMQMPLDTLGAGNDELRQLFEQFYGEDGKIDTYVAPINAKQVAVAYVSEDNLKRLFASAKSNKGLAENKEVQTTLKSLPENPQVVGLISLQGAAQFARQIAEIAVPHEERAQMPAIPEFPAAPPLGVSWHSEGKAMQGALVVPAETVTALGKYIKSVQQAAAQ